MTTKHHITKINTEGQLVRYDGNKWVCISMPWGWQDITPGYRRESRRNYKNAKRGG